jgi:hemoglobin
MDTDTKTLETTPAPTRRRTLYDAIGGPAAVGAAVDGLYDRLLGDPATAHFFEGVDVAKVNGHMRLFLTSALRGVAPRGGRDLGAAHAHLGITDADFDRVAGHLVATLEGLGLGADLVGGVVGLVAPMRSVVVAVPALGHAAPGAS